MPSHKTQHTTGKELLARATLITVPPPTCSTHPAQGWTLQPGDRGTGLQLTLMGGTEQRAHSGHLCLPRLLPSAVT